MTIAIDCRMIDASGIGVYLRGILLRMLASTHNFLLAGDPEKLKSFASETTRVIPYTAGSFSIREVFFCWEKAVRRLNKADVFFSPFFNIPSGITIPVFTTIHDIIFPDMPELTSRLGLIVRMGFYRRAFALSKKIFTVSVFSKSRIEAHMGMSTPVIVTHSAPGTQFFEYRANGNTGEKTETLVYVGNIKKHKGLHFLLDVFLLAKKEGLPHKLVIIGERKNFRTADNTILQKIDSLRDDSVCFTGFVSGKELMAYLASAALLVQPSLYEGFGLPPLEAMLLGTRALISDIPVFREIYGDFPVTFFRTGDSADLADKLRSLLADKTQMLTLSENLARKYNFEKTASIIMDAITKGAKSA